MDSLKELEMFKKFVGKFFYIDYDGTVKETYNECYEISERMPEFCSMIKKYVKENWKEEELAKKENSCLK